VNRKLPHLGCAGQGDLLSYFEALRDRLRNVRVCCGDWSRVTGPTVTHKHGITGVFLDPPYDLDIRDAGCYSIDAPGIAKDVRQWCIANQGNPLLRIALCGYEGKHEMPGWDCVAWKAHGGYSNRSESGDNGNKHKERIWFSPHCLNERTLFDL